MPDVGLDFEDLTRVHGGIAPQIFPVVGNTPAGLLLLLILLLLLLLLLLRLAGMGRP
jgi:hypothetical protein